MRTYAAQGVTFVREKIIRREHGTPCSPSTLPRATCSIDLAWNIDCCEILQWCHDHGVLYLNTSVEVWDPYDRELYQHPTERTLYCRHMNIRRMMAGWKEPGRRPSSSTAPTRA